ncbi:MAG TPA: response regulator [Burkholderiaceae bacterium]
MPTTPSNPDSPASLRVLLVDDNVDALESMEILLQAFGHQVAIAPHPDQALQLVDGFRPDAAVIDIGLPGMDGYQLAAEIRRRHPDRALRLIAFTGYGGPEDVAKAHAAGFDAHVVKPVDIDRLLAVLQA